MISINTNSPSSLAALNLQKSSDLLQKSLARLSSGSRISSPQDDAGGYAVSLKLSSAVKRTQNASANVANALSLLQVQAGSLKTAATVLDRLSELATLGSDVTKSSSDISNYCTEYMNLVVELNTLSADSFNGINLFSGAVGTLKVYISQDGAQTMQVSQANLTGAYSVATAYSAVTAAGVSALTAAVQALATIMATNGAEASRVQFALDSLNVNQVNLEAALSRIYDVDVASETSKLARANILVQAGAAMLTQANASQSIALKLLQ